MTTVEELWDIPPSWEWTTLSGLGDIVGGGTPSTKEPKYWGNEVNWISPADLTGYTSKTIARGAKRLTATGLDNSSAKVMPPGSVHFSSRAPIGYVVISAAPMATNQGFKSLVPSDGIFNEYVYYFLKSATQLARKRASGTTFLELSGSGFAALPIPVAPQNEQSRIVAKIEELFSELDKGVEALTTARQQLTAYRHAILKHAFEGKLTAEWRVSNPASVQTSDQLLAHLKRSREAIREVENDVLSNLPPLPSGYFYTYLSNLGEIARGKSKHRPRNDPRLFDGKYPFIQTGEVKAANRTIRDFSQTYNEVGLAQSHLWPKGTLCITIAANIAETAFLGFDACFPDSVVGFTAIPEIVLAEYVELFIKAVRVRIEAYAPATAQKNINLTTLENLIVPLCSLEEQRILVSRIEEILSVVESNDSDFNDNLARAEALRQSVLKRAFSGQLVPQDPNDEPASVLLERICAERQDEAPTKRRINRIRKKKTA